MTVEETAPAVSVVVPCLNEEANLPALVEQLASVLDARDRRWELVLVDDGSSDGTVPVMRHLSNADPRVRFLSLSRRFGKDAALLAGLRAARGAVVVMMDADLQHPPELVPVLLDTLEAEGVDQVVAVRSRTGETAARRWASRAFHGTVTRRMEVDLPPGHGDFRAATRRVVDAVLTMPEAHRFTRGIFAWVGYEVAEIAYDDAPRAGGSSGWTVSALVGYSTDAVLSFSDRPLRFMIRIGWASVVLFGLYLAFVLVSVLAFGIETPGYVTIIASVFFFGGVQLVSIGLLGEYLGRIFIEVKRRPSFVVRESSGPYDEQTRPR